MNQPQYSSVYPSGAAIARSSLSAEKRILSFVSKEAPN